MTVLLNINEGSRWRRGWPCAYIALDPLFLYLSVYLFGRYRRLVWAKPPSRRERIRRLSLRRRMVADAWWQIEQLDALVFRPGGPEDHEVISLR